MCFLFAGKSLGTAEVVFIKKADAAQVVKDFDGVPNLFLHHYSP
jgi:hypothetical protein